VGSRIDPSRPADDEPPSKADLRRNLEIARRELSHGGFFRPIGAGAPERTVEDRLHDLVSVKDFGAAGDGSRDDAAEIQAAIDAGAGIVLVPRGWYRIGRPIELRGQTLLAKGAGFAPTRDFPPEGGPASSLIRIRGNRSVIIGCSLSGRDPDEVRRAQHGVRLERGVNRAQVEDVYIALVQEAGIHGEAHNWMSRFENVRCDSVDTGFRFAGEGNTTLTFQACYCAGSRTGFAFRHVFGFALTGCAVDGSKSFALEFEASVGTVVAGYFEGCRQALRLVSRHANVTMTGCAYSRLGDPEGDGPAAVFDLQNGRLVMEQTRFVRLQNFRHFVVVPASGRASTFRENTISVLEQDNDIQAAGGVIEVQNGVTERSDGATISFLR